MLGHYIRLSEIVPERLQAFTVLGRGLIAHQRCQSLYSEAYQDEAQSEGDRNEFLHEPSRIKRGTSLCQRSSLITISSMKKPAGHGPGLRIAGAGFALYRIVRI
jgi:hypothetical protein